MDIATAISLVTTVVETFIKVEPVIASTITDQKPFATALFERLTGQQISDSDRLTIETSIDALHAEFQQPIPVDSDQ